MLFGEEFGRRHHHGLMPAFDCAQRRPERDDGFSTANVAHQHAVHLASSSRGRRLSRRSRVSAAVSLNGCSPRANAQMSLRAVQRDSGATSRALALDRQRQFKREQFIERQRSVTRDSALRPNASRSASAGGLCKKDSA